MKKITLLLAVIFFFFSSCVSIQKYQEATNEKEKLQDENAYLKKENQRLTTLTNEQGALIKKLEKELKSKENEFMLVDNKYKKLIDEHEQLSNSYDVMLNQYKSILAGKKSETSKILTELQETQSILREKEDELNEKSINLALLSSQLDSALREMNLTKSRLIKLQNILDEKEAAVKALKAKVSEALLGFEGKGLSIYEKNGKVYVSLEENLLFASGSYEVGVKGKDALKKLAIVLETNPDINIMIEGHTDNVPYISSGQIRDNWDLSVMRATSIVNILVTNSRINPKRLTAAGRGEYVPLDTRDTKEAKSKNRRTEIILTPKLDELFKIIESN
ncbi:OmpA family protein [candidate division KSB1 bacterium]